MVYLLLTPIGMKANKKSLIIKALYLATPFLMLIGCAKDNSNSNRTVTAQDTYYMSNGTCFSNQTRRAVSTSYCYNTSSNYTLSNGTCYITSTGRAVDISYCNDSYNNGSYNNGYQNNYNTTSSQCLGTYYTNTNGGVQTVNCNGTNCRGLTLYDSTGRFVTCQ